MEKEGGKTRISISINPKTLKELDKYCSQIKKGLKVNRSPIIEIAIQEYVKREKK